MVRAARELRAEDEGHGIGLAVTPPKKGRLTKRASLAVVPDSGSKAETVPMEYARCRSLGHTWAHRNKPYNPQDDGGSWYLQSGMAGFVSVCTSCQTKRTKWVMRSGSLGPTTYDYPEGYSTHGEERLRPMDWRRAFVVRVFGD
jgi:hypothetical protein